MIPVPGLNLRSEGLQTGPNALPGSRLAPWSHGHGERDYRPRPILPVGMGPDDCPYGRGDEIQFVPLPRGRVDLGLPAWLILPVVICLTRTILVVHGRCMRVDLGLPVSSAQKRLLHASFNPGKRDWMLGIEGGKWVNS